ncbi:MAG: FAD-binding protein [Bacteroidia bacterium]|nr:FAD-binding protein [Bacteroidia bacterium]
MVMENWSGNITWEPGEVAYPETEEDIQNIVIQAANDGRKIRTIGTRHSFNPLFVTEDILLSLDNYQGLVEVDKQANLVTVKGGTKLSELGELLFLQGLAMENQGDIDAQSIAGTISTGTHGTGLAFGTISTQVARIKLINGKGEIVTCSEEEDRDLFKAAQVSLGMLGVITEVTLRCVPAYRLELQNRQESLEDVLNEFDARINANRNFEFYFFPYSKKVWTKTLNLAVDIPHKVTWFNDFTENVLENRMFSVLCEYARRFPSRTARVARISASMIPNVRKVYQSHRVYATKRLVRFNEMEYNVPLEAHGAVVSEMRKAIDKHRFRVHFPVENRVVKGDDIYLSPAYERDSAYIACHVYHKKDYQPYFEAMEEIFRDHGGRPHWGKMHTLKQSDLADLYPRLEDFRKQQKAMDPNGLFDNPYLNLLFKG